MDFVECVEKELEFQRNMLQQFRRLKAIRSEGELFYREKPGGYKEFYIKRPGAARRRYVCKRDFEQVTRLQVKKYGEVGAEAAEGNIELLSKIVDGYNELGMSALNGKLPEAYRMPDVTRAEEIRRLAAKPFPQSENSSYSEHLIHSTNFGLIVRSKNEVHIAERLRAAQIEFYYERALKLWDGESGNWETVFPDFTIMLPDGRKIFWEHAGRMDKSGYRERHNRKMKLYYENGIYQPHNLIVTFDGPDGRHPGIEIGLIIDKVLVPAAKSRF